MTRERYSGSGPTATTADTAPSLDAPQRVAEHFRQQHGHYPDGVWSAPGRVNFIGEHTDYNDGFVLPFALPHRIAVAAARREDGMLGLTTIGDDGKRQQAAPVDIKTVQPGEVRGWASYPAGVAWALREHSRLIVDAGAELVITGDVPAGAGLSSSAALECSVGLALLGLAGIDPDHDPALGRSTLAHLTQRSENEFVGAPTGILDQTASLCCTADRLLFLDVRTGATEQVPFALAEQHLAVLVIDTRASHQHAESGYGERRRGCERAAQLLGVPALRDVTTETLPDALEQLPADLHPLVRHVVTENERVEAVVRGLRKGAIDEIGPLLTASHASMRDDYRISCRELDLAVDVALTEGAAGARMTGGGFGGSAIALVARDRIEPLAGAVRAAFRAEQLMEPRMFVGVPSPGAGREPQPG